MQAGRFGKINMSLEGKCCWEIDNRPFYRYGGRIELIGSVRSIMGCLGGMSTISYTCISIYACFSGQFFFKFSRKRL